MKMIILLILKRYFGEHMFVPTFTFYKGYSIPILKTVKEYLDTIEKLPLVDTPEIFGMHPNADIAYVDSCSFIQV